MTKNHAEYTYCLEQSSDGYVVENEVAGIQVRFESSRATYGGLGMLYQLEYKNPYLFNRTVATRQVWSDQEEDFVAACEQAKAALEVQLSQLLETEACG